GRGARQVPAGGLRPRAPDAPILDELRRGQYAPGPGEGMTIGLLELLFLLAAWGIVPLGLRLLPDSRPMALARRLQPLAALFATISFFIAKGPIAAALAAPWLILNGLVALAGLMGLKAALRGGIPALL